MVDDPKPKSTSDAVRVAVISGLFTVMTVVLTNWQAMPWNNVSAALAEEAPAPSTTAVSGIARPNAYFSAIAVSGDGHWGASIQRPSNIGATDTAKRAREDAQNRCGSDCEVVMVGEGRCLAVAHAKANDSAVGYAVGNERSVVNREAIAACSVRSGGQDCSVEHSDCL